ncbi:MAG: biotin carboxylase N-terminal domain-containing protein [Armatimonas sp.]
MKRLLIANRGEIAARIIKTCRAMGIETVAVYSEADRESPHVAMADAAVCLGPGPASESYLRADAVLEAARAYGADAVHPGYGFLSENAVFSDACAEVGITFVGPSGAVIRALGDKIGAKRTMAAAGVPVVPGYNGDDQNDEMLRAEAAKIGTPLLIKASAGGGGRGMRRVDDLMDFQGTLTEARAEAQSAFGDARVLLEKYVQRPRHVEVQLFGDSKGNVVHLFERECSIQRRHQKILEESPAPGLSEELRAKLHAAAVLAGQTVGYVGAGTVEFLVEANSFYFLEVNTRLQVEHPVTEAVTGLDLVRWQLLVAQGERLPLLQKEITSRGHAIEARVYAEDPAGGLFLPSLGTLLRWREPTGPGIRVDSGFAEGMIVPPFYDPMLAKVIASAEDRSAALARLEQALRCFVLLGVGNNLAFLQDIVGHPSFQSGETHTGFLGEHFPRWQPEPEAPTEVLLALANLAVTPSISRVTDKSLSPWKSANKFRNI